MTARQIILEGGSPWGFRMHGGADVQQPLRISRVNPGSKAAARGVREGDVITTINGESTRNKTNSEAHALLKSAGNTLKLGLNQDCIGSSPKKRQYNNTNDNNTTSTQQEILTETIKRSNIITKFIISSSSTSTSNSATTTTTNLRTETPSADNPATNRDEISKDNGEKNSFKLNGDSTIKPTPKDYYFSDRSTISSNYSSAASTPSTLTESQVSPPTTQQRNEPPNDMSDSGSSRSRRRKRSNHKGKRPIPPAVEETTYRVESPKTVQKRKSPLTKKSKSLDDDDDSIQIREVCETSECSAVEDDSDPIIWEVAEDMNVNQIQNETVRITTTQTLKLEDKAQLQSITPEDETKLRCFLEGLRLVSTPEEAADRAVQSRESAESIKARRAKKREELAQYFLPVYQNPRFLDVISEENSDQSDKEQKERGSYGNSTPTTQKTVITEMDSARIPIISDTCTTSIAQTGSSVEIVYLEDSSGCESESAESIEDTDAKIDVKDVLSSQLTPPPTPDEKLDEIRRISKETVMQNVFGNTQIQCFNLHEIESDNKAPLLPMHRVNVVSPSHLSECSGDSSSRGTSLCTTIYREELPNEMLSLRELCLKKLISLPFGRDILEELASVSESLEELTNNLSSSHQLHHNNNRTVPASSSVKLTQNTTEDRINTSDDFDISAASPMVSTKTKPAPKEAVGAKNLLDLHEKFAQIRGNHQNTVDESSNSSRLLALIRGTDSSESTAVESGGHVQEQQRTLEERSGDEARLDARNLSEWLNLARAKSGSVPHLNNLDNMKDPLPKPDGITTRRRRSLPQEIYIQQMQYLIQKEKEIQQELEKLEEEKRKLASEMNTTDDQHHFDPSQYKISKNQDIAIHQPNPNKSTIPPASERFRQNMYDEYMTQIAKRQDRQQHKVIKISSHQIPTTESRGKLEAIHVKGIEDEFMNKVKQRKLKYAATTSEDSADYASLPERSDAEDSEPVLVMDGDSLSEAKRLPKHLKEFVAITREAACNLDTEDGIWSPGSQKDPTSSPEGSLHVQRSLDQDTEPIPPVWAPKSAGSSPSLERKEFRSVNFGSPVLGRKNKDSFSENTSIDPPWKNPTGSSDISVALSSSLEKRIPNSYSAPGFGDFPNPRLPKAQNPTITLLQKARGGHLPKGAAYIEQDSNPHQHLSRHESSPPKLAPGEIVYEIKHEYTSESDNERPKKMADLSQRKYPLGIGPTTKDGMPLTLRSEVKDQNQSKWYKRMYDTIHKQKPRYDDDYVTIRYKQRRGRYPYNSGYLSEPEPGAYDSDASIYDHRVTPLDRRRTQPAPVNGGGGSDNYVISYTMPRSSSNSYTPQTSTIIKHGKEVYKNQPGRIENYVPGRSSISDKEAKEWWDEVMDIFDGHLEQQKHIPHKGYMSQALKESGYESDSTLVFRRRDENINQLSPSEQREAYKTIQRGGDVPLHGLRKPAPERPKDDLNIEYIPISPNLTKIRVHKNPIGDRLDEFLVYPSQTEHIFANYKRTAPSTLNMSKSFPPIPPSPPKRKSSRNNSTLRLISTMRVSSEKPAKRHQTCFISTADVNKSNVKFLRDKITCKLSSVPKRRGEAKLRVTKTLTASPELKSKVSTTLAAVKDPKTSASKIYSKTNISRDDSVERSSLSRSSSTNSVRKACRSCSATQSRKSNGTLEKSRAASLDRTFGSEKKKVDLRLSKSASEKRLIKSPDLLSPTEVKKASLITQDPFKSPIKHTRAIPKVQTKLQDLPIKVSISEKGRELLQSNAKSTSKSLRSRTDSVSPSPSLSSDKSKLSRSSTSLESIKSSKAKKDRITLKKTPSIRSLKSTTSKENLCVSKKAKKDQLNDEIVKKEKKNGKAKIRDPAKAIGKGVGSEIVKKIYRNFDSESSKNPITLEDIKRQKRNVDTSSFFQNLFLRDNPTSNSITCSANSWIAEKTLALQRRSASVSEPSIGALKIYLNHTKPVTDSKFKTMDAQLIRSRSVSPKNVRWEDETKREYSRRAVGYERSSSLPPKLVFTETSRPISPIIQRRRLDTDSTRTTIIRPTSPQKMIFTETRRPISPVLKRKSTLKRIEKKKQQPEKIIFTETARPISPEIRSRSASPKNIVKTQKSTPPETLYFSQTSRPISPVIEASPDTVIRSPSYRKIRSLHGDSLEYIRRKAPRSRSAGDADENHYKGSDFDPPSLTQSTSSIDSLKEYQTYVKEVIHSTKKSDRFKDLNKFYSTIERLGELERTTSSADLRPRRRGEEEIIDYDRWKEVRQREKAEKELGEIYKELKVTQKEKDFLFAPKQVETYRWKKDFDRGLRIKEKSVEDIREEFERLLFEDRNNNLREFDYRRDTYKPLWRGNSVANLAQTITERRSQSEGRSIPSKQKKMESERFLTRGIGSRIWSSLSMEQVNVLKNQLAEIYQNGSKKGQTQSQQPKEYIIEVPSDTYKDSQSVLTVRRNSDSSKSMSETDKRRISQSLSKEILERQRQRYKTSVSLVLGKETRGAVAAADARVKQIEPPSPRTCYSLEMSEDGDKDIKKPSDGDFLLVLAKSDTKNKANIKETLTEWAQPKKALISTDAVNIPPKTTSSESGSTDGSTKTVICVDKKEDVKKKVEYFEKVHETQDYTPTIYKAADSTSGSPEETDDVTPKSTISPLKKHSPLSRSQQDLKELFGETEMAKVASPISTIPSSGTSVKSPLTRSTESVYRSRSLSPHPDLYYFTLAKAGDVSKLKNKFERKWNSDSQIHKKSQICIPGQMLGEVDHLRRRYEYPALSGRGRSRIRRGGVVSPIYLKAEDRFMPHINIISKIASLYPRKSVREDRQDRSIENLADILGITVGEVKKLRAKFDSPDRGDVSLLGHMFTSSPNLHELRDIAPYLTASWTAHRFPKREDNERPLTPPVPPPTSAPSVVRRPKSASPPRAKAKLSSILKPEASKAAEGRKQEFNASAHRPISRYQPPAPRTQEPARYRSWWGPSVTFKEPDAPTPPPKGLSRRASEPESPRKYVENEVTIHYRTPVRQEIKEALSEDELQRRQAEHMKKIYQEERRRKYLQVSHSLDELQDMHSRRHADNFTPSQKSPIPLNRYDDFLDDYSPKLKPRPRSPEPRLVAKALYNFVGQSARELTFRKGDIIYIRRQVDKNWYEGEHNAMVGLFPANYVEIVPYDGIKTTVRKPHEGQARAKYNFIAQTHLELSLAKGELVVITRKVDDNWFEGKIGGRKGIFPVSYVDVLIDPGTPPQSAPSPTKPVAAPAAHSLLLNGSLGGKESMGAHNYVPPFHGSDTTPSYHAKPVQVTGSGTYGSLSRTKNLNQALHIDTQSEPVPYRALYKYKPQNEDELELLEGDTVYVLEKCDDGWYVGSSDRTGAFGTFPGNYVERI